MSLTPQQQLSNLAFHVFHRDVRAQLARKYADYPRAPDMPHYAAVEMGQMPVQRRPRNCLSAGAL